MSEGAAYLVPGNKVAFTEDHPEHAGMYGVVEAVTRDADGIYIDLTILDPATGLVDDPPVSYKATDAEIQ